jgi:hypothetical protein
MSNQRAFSADGLPRKKEDYHGGANFARTSPDVAAKGIQSTNVYFSFEEAIKFSLAVQSCVLQLNRLNRSKKQARDMGMSLSFKFESKAVSVIEAPLSGVRRPPLAADGDE